MRTLSMMRSFAAVAVFASALAACGGDKSAATGTTGGATGSAKPVASAAAAKPVETAKPVEMIDHDLSSADPKWAGWTVKGPADAKVMQDGSAGARVAANGPGMLDRKEGGDNGFDVAFAWGKTDLKNLKTNLEKGAASSPPDFKVTNTWVKDDADVLEWTTQAGKSTSYNFVKHMKVDGKDITCKNNYMVGSGNEAEHKRVMDACATLAKK